jgi:hypothetical protein
VTGPGQIYVSTSLHHLGALQQCIDQAASFSSRREVRGAALQGRSKAGHQCGHLTDVLPHLSSFTFRQAPFGHASPLPAFLPSEGGG